MDQTSKKTWKRTLTKIISFISDTHSISRKVEETKEEQGEEAEEEKGERPRLVMMRRMESETTSYDWSTDSESLRLAETLTPELTQFYRIQLF